MAATLIHIKSKMLLPRPETAAGVEGEEEDPRDALVRRLLEHQKFKAAAGLLHEREQLRAAQWLRPDERVAELAGDDYEPELEVDLFSLLTAFQAVVAARQAAAEGAAAAGADAGRGAHRAAARAPVGDRSLRLRGSVRRRRRSQRADRHVSGAARNDPAEARAGLPGRQLRPDPRLQAPAAGRCAASDWRSGGTTVDEDEEGRAGQDGQDGQEGQDGRRGRRRRQDGEMPAERGAAPS